MLFFKNKEHLIPHINKGSLPQIYLGELNQLLQEYMVFGGYPEVVLETDLDEKVSELAELEDSYVKRMPWKPI